MNASFTFRPAVREQTTLLIGLAGPSSSGKTYSALRLATGMADGGPIFMIDTESRRGLHYADQFKFQHGELAAPFRPKSYLQAIEAAKSAGAKVIIVDSMSHEHEGPGGILEWHEQELERMAGSDYAKRERVKFTAWIKPKRAHNQFVNSVLQLGVHVIFCFRAKPKLQMVKVNGKTEVVDIGWQPICADRFEYEMTGLFMLPPKSQGTPDLEAPAFKIEEQHKGIVSKGQQIDEEMGKRFVAWADGAKPKPKAASKPNGQTPDFLAVARQIAGLGRPQFERYLASNEGKRNRKKLEPHFPELREIAAKADATLKDKQGELLGAGE